LTYLQENDHLLVHAKVTQNYIYDLLSVNKRWRTPNGQLKTHNPEKPATQGTQDEDKH
jgi:hypothetical protein